MPRHFNYRYLPKQHQNTHDYCLFLLNHLEELILDKKFIKLREQSLTMPPEQLKSLENYQGNIFDFLEENKLTKETDHIIKCKLMYSLTIESSYFLQEAFECSLKMRLTVVFTLFRKPFFEVLIIYMRLFFETNFITRFNIEENFNPLILSKIEKKQYLELLNEVFQNIYDTEELFDFLFNKSDPQNLYNIGNNAIHLYTNRNPAINTEKQNLNFIFSTQDDINDQWEYIYDVLPMLLNFFLDVTDLCVMSTIEGSENLISRRFIERQNMRKRFKLV